jgi:hypothetical protein
MPVTPFHFGPGAAIKAVIPRHFSLMVFCFSQCIIDSEVIFFILKGEYPIHRWFHTYVGAVPVALFSILVGRPLSESVIRLWTAWRYAPFKDNFPALSSTRISLWSAATGAFIGSFSHVFLDSLMHPDLVPMRPFSSANPLYGQIGLVALHVICVIAGALAVYLYAVRSRTAK